MDLLLTGSPESFMLLLRFFPSLSPCFTGILSSHNQITSGICLKFSLKKLNSLYNGVCTPYLTAFPTQRSAHQSLETHSLPIQSF